jgi:hypothetical protein
MFTKVASKNERQSVWHAKTEVLDCHFLCSTSIDHSEVMIFECNKDGTVEDWIEVYCDYTQVFNHHDHMERYYKEIS